jgi:hypothetical protein
LSVLDVGLEAYSPLALGIQWAVRCRRSFWMP